MTTFLINLKRKDEGLAIAEERIQPNEEEHLQAIITQFTAHPGRREQAQVGLDLRSQLLDCVGVAQQSRDRAREGTEQLVPLRCRHERVREPIQDLGREGRRNPCRSRRGGPRTRQARPRAESRTPLIQYSACQ